jgi:molecular chaperone IbpA
MVGFDSLLGDLEATFGRDVVGSNYPPYNLIKADDDNYELEIAVTGFASEELTVEISNRQLIVSGQKDREDSNLDYLHRGLATRNFTRVWVLAEHMEVGNARIKNGVLAIPLNRVIPEELKPRKITVVTE